MMMMIFLEVNKLAVDIICFFACSQNDVSTYIVEYLHHELRVTVVKLCCQCCFLVTVGQGCLIWARVIERDHVSYLGILLTTL
jgi:hypothetical protein